MNSLSVIQQNVLEFIILRWESGEALPSCREIARRFGWASPKAATDVLEALKRKGFLISDPSSTRKYRLGEQALGLPILGEIPAGFPGDSEENQEERLTLTASTFGIRDRASAFFLRVRGDSMTGRQIFNGDLVLVEKFKEPKHKDVVAALIDNESTLKTFVREAGQCWLKSENPKYPELFPAHDLQIQGVARSVIRFLPS